MGKLGESNAAAECPLLGGEDDHHNQFQKPNHGSRRENGQEGVVREAKMPVENTAITTRKPTARSRVSNGKDWLAGVDQRSSIARRYRDLMAGVASDLGGVEQCSQAKIQLARRFAALSVQLEQLDAKLADGADIDIAEYTSLTSTLVRVVSRLGIERVPKLVGPSLGDILRADLAQQREQQS